MVQETSTHGYALPYVFRIEELLAHYVSFLKILSSKLNERTVRFCSQTLLSSDTIVSGLDAGSVSIGWVVVEVWGLFLFIVIV